MSPFAMLAEEFLEAKNELRADFHPGNTIFERRSSVAVSVPEVRPGPARSDTDAELAPSKPGNLAAAPELIGLDYRTELTRSLLTIKHPLIAVEQLLDDSLKSRRETVQPLLDYVAELGGKRLRPALLLLTAQALAPINEQAIRLAVVVELVHTATLVHDDILDAATMRRHRSSLHQEWDVPRAILIGDWLFTQAYSLANAGDSTVPGRWVAAAAKAVCEGEIQQGSAAGRGELTEREYFQMLSGKTGALCAISCGLGAWSAGADLKLCEQMYDFGMKLGIAFQIHDDWLDIWGDATKTGKPTGSDVQGGKWTLPILRYLSTATEANCQTMTGLLNDQLSNDNFAQVRSMLDASDASEYARASAHRLVEEALSGLESIPDNAERLALRRLALAAIQRTC